MTTDDRPANVNWVPVERVEINITVQDILDNLAAEAGSMAQPGPGAALDPALAQLLQQFTQLTAQLKDVISKIHAIDPTFLAGE